MGRIDLELDGCWERQPDEEGDEYASFLVYRDLPPPASVEDACRKAMGGEPDPATLEQWRQWAEDWEWEERARRFRESTATGAAYARELTERWKRAQEFYEQNNARPEGTASWVARLFRRGPARPRKESFLKRWLREREVKRHFRARQAAALRAERSKKKQSLAERWTLYFRRRREALEKEKDKGLRGRILRAKRQARVLLSRHTGRFLLVFGALFMLIGALLGMLFLRWRRLVFQHAVVVAVNQASIRRDEFQARLEEAAARTVLQELIEKNLRRQFAMSKKAYPKESEVEARMKEDQQDPTFAKYLAASGMTLENYKDAVRDEIAQANLMAEGISVTDEEVRRYYERNIDRKNRLARFYIPETIQVAVIGTRTREAALAALEDLRQGVPWEEAARTHSLDVSAFSGGVLPPFARGRTMASMIPGMEATIFALEPGQRIGPVNFGEGWWIIQCRQKTPEKTFRFEQVKMRARLWARMEKGIPKNGRRVASEYARFQKRARIQVFDPFFRGLMAR